MRGKSFGMQLPREILDGGDNSRRWAIYCVADDGKAAVAHGVKTSPSGPFGDDVELILSAIGMGLRENEKVGLQTDNFFETHVRPVLRGVDDGSGARQPQSIGDKGVFSEIGRAHV